nr:hypothetical protein [uncultured Desulfobulbus sp.]
MFGNVEEDKYMYEVFAKGEVLQREPGFAFQRVEFGMCLEKCPQQIEIPEVLKRVVAELAGEHGGIFLSRAMQAILQ